MMLVSAIVSILVLAALYILSSTLWVKYSLIHLGDPASKKVTVVQITDLHGQTHFINGSLSKMVNRVNPDLVMITGDLASTKEELDKVLKEIRQIKCERLFFVPGNHERYGLVQSRFQLNSDQDYEAILRTIGDANITVLSNREFPVDIGDKKWLIYGFDNSLYGKERLTMRVDELHSFDVIIMLAHSPSIIETSLQKHIPYDLLLVGHTHGGQIRLFGRTIGAYKNYHVGLKRIDKRKHFYINRGLGTSRLLPIRFACSPEIAVFKIDL
ncbi:metallophosphoesterase [Paenibacillus qinlingensis]|uniref:metallophosphoesterase n=1 Tax=Paenibacillus qinlingensis TaxID=1837343 RepID=UPI0015646A4A|nr:metallophosphoesterase [Paenibacillus qinlingensis]NQX58366.1 metallophosphoesterase [Paenibacillus qinlingensis]